MISDMHYSVATSEWIQLRRKSLTMAFTSLITSFKYPISLCASGLCYHYESFDLSKTHSLSAQDLVKTFIDSFITMTAGRSFQIKNCASYSGHINPTTMCSIQKNSEKWGESKYVKSERLGIVPGTWFGKRMDVIISNIFLHDILYTVRFVKMRRIQWYHFHYVNRAGKRPPQQNTAFFDLALC